MDALKFVYIFKNSTINLNLATQMYASRQSVRTVCVCFVSSATNETTGSMV